MGTHGNNLNPLVAFEKALDNALDAATGRVNTFVEKSPLATQYERFRERAPSIRERRFDTPLGRVITPEVSLPKLGHVELKPERREALKAAIAIDISSVIGIIPVVGDILADVVEDVYGGKLRDSLTKEEMDMYTKYDKAGPSTLAIMRTFVRSGMRRDA